MMLDMIAIPPKIASSVKCLVVASTAFRAAQEIVVRAIRKNSSVRIVCWAKAAMPSKQKSEARRKANLFLKKTDEILLNVISLLGGLSAIFA
jgi:hypothetical protein